MAHPAIVDHLVELGVTAVELLPVHHFLTEGFLAERGLVNYWGYSTIGFLAPHSGYAATGERGQQVDEFKQLVKALHRAGIEVILDVVYNHTNEGNRTRADVVDPRHRQRVVLPLARTTTAAGTSTSPAPATASTSSTPTSRG